MRSFPWDSTVEYEELGGLRVPVFDRSYTAADLQDIMKIFFSNGVFLNTNNALQVTAGAGMTVNVAPGRGMINGTSSLEDSVRSLAITAASSQDRIDTVVLRWNANLEGRSIDLYVVPGIASDSPVRPSLTRTETIYELGLADIFIPKITSAITNERITDTRLETARCGVASPFMQIDTTTFYNQINAALAQQIGELQDQTNNAIELSQELIDGTALGELETKLQTEIDGKLDVDGKAADAVKADSAKSATSATSASKLATARTIQTNLASTSAASFDGSTNVTPGISGTLAIGHGGTGATTAANARTNLGLGALATLSSVALSNCNTALQNHIPTAGTTNGWFWIKFVEQKYAVAFKRVEKTNFAYKTGDPYKFFDETLPFPFSFGTETGGAASNRPTVILTGGNYRIASIYENEDGASGTKISVSGKCGYAGTATLRIYVCVAGTYV